MTERVARPTDALKAGWRTDAGGNPILEPNASKRADGWAFEEQWPHQEANWQFKLHGDLWLWLFDFMPREWLDLKQGIDGHVAPQRFVVGRPASGNLYRGYVIFSEPTQSLELPTWVVTDGRRIYYIDANVAVEGQNVVAMDPEDGIQLWTQAKVTTELVGLASDGDRVYTSEDGQNGVDVRSPSTGAISAHGGTQGELRFMATNGVFLIGEFTNSIYFLNDLDAAPVETGFVSYGAVVRATAIDTFRAYVTGEQAAGMTRCYDLVSRALLWSVDPPTTVQPLGAAIATDGDHLYVGTDNVVLTAGGDNVNLFVYDRTRGVLVGAYEIGANSDDVKRLAVDDRWLYVTTENATGGVHREIHIIDLRSGLVDVRQPVSVNLPAALGDETVWACDGVGAVIVDNASAGGDPEIRRDLIHTKPRNFQRVAGDDSGRQPFFNAAIPI